MYNPEKQPEKRVTETESSVKDKARDIILALRLLKNNDLSDSTPEQVRSEKLEEEKLIKKLADLKNNNEADVATVEKELAE